MVLWLSVLWLSVLYYFVTEITTHPEDKLVAVNSMVNLTCTSSVSSNVVFSWTHNETSINGSSTSGDTSILTITSVRNSDAGSYVCIVSSGSLSVMSNTATLTVYGIVCVCSVRMRTCVCVCVFSKFYNTSLYT